MQIIKGLGKLKEEKDVKFSESIGYFGNIRLMEYRHKNNESQDCWYVMVECNGDINKHELSFIKKYDSVLPMTKIQVIVKDTSFGDINLSEFKSLKTYSILETIPENLLKYMDNL